MKAHIALNPESAISRRELGKAVAGAALAVGFPAAALANDSDKAKDGRSFRFVYLPDIHLMKDRRSPQGMAAALQAATRLDPQPDFLLTGGDLIDSLRDMNLEQAVEMAELFEKIWSDNTDLPAHHALGNHDAAGWRNDDFPRQHPDFAYNLLRKELKMPNLYYSFDHGGWHFVVLHNIRLIEPKSYVSEFSEEQMKFLRNDLARQGSKPTMLFGHFPPLSAIEFFDGRASHSEGDWTLSSQRMSRNPMALVQATEGANVKAFLSGHIYRLDRIEAMGRTFLSVAGRQRRQMARPRPPDSRRAFSGGLSRGRQV